MEDKKYNPWEKLNSKLGSAQAGTFVGSKTDVNGITSKVIADDAVVNEALVPPGDMDNAVLVGGVNIEVSSSISYKPKVMSDSRLRTCEISITTAISPLTPGTYGKDAKRPDSGNPSPKT